MTRIRKALGLAVGVFLCIGACQARAAAAGITVFGGPATLESLTEIAKIYEADGNGKVTLVFAPTKTQVGWIENGATADVIVSSNADRLDYLEGKNLLLAGSRSDLVGNRIVFIVPASSPVRHLKVSPQLDLLAILGRDGLLAVNDPAHTGVGRYAKTALEHLKLWPQVANRTAPAQFARESLAMVERGESPLGIVYASEAATSDKVRVVGAFHTESHPNISIDCQVAALRTPNSAAALNFIKFLHTPQAKKIWVKYGFEPVTGSAKYLY
jgi:molybdate transport system substrate-binding protein